MTPLGIDYRVKVRESKTQKWKKHRFIKFWLFFFFKYRKEKTKSSSKREFLGPQETSCLVVHYNYYICYIKKKKKLYLNKFQTPGVQIPAPNRSKKQKPKKDSSSEFCCFQHTQKPLTVCTSFYHGLSLSQRGLSFW